MLYRVLAFLLFAFVSGWSSCVPYDKYYSGVTNASCQSGNYQSSDVVCLGGLKSCSYGGNYGGTCYFTSPQNPMNCPSGNNYVSGIWQNCTKNCCRLSRNFGKGLYLLFALWVIKWCCR